MRLLQMPLIYWSIRLDIPRSDRRLINICGGVVPPVSAAPAGGEAAVLVRAPRVYIPTLALTMPTSQENVRVFVCVWAITRCVTSF